MPYTLENTYLAVFSGVKSDGKKILNNCIIEDNRIRYDMTKQTSSTEGIVEVEIILYGEDDETLCSPRFDLVVDDRAIGDDIISEDEKIVLDSYALAEAERVKNEAQRNIELQDGRIDNKGKEHTNIGTHIRTVDSKIDDYFERVDLIEKGVTEEIGSLTNVGVNSANTNYRTSDYILVKPNTKYVTNKLNQHIAIYDENKNCINCYNMVYSITTPENAVFIRVDYNINTTDSIENIKLCEGDLVDVDAILSDKVSVRKVEPESVPFYEKSANLFDCTKPYHNGYVLDSAVGKLNAKEKFQTSDYIEVKPNTNYIGNYTNHIAYYDENKTKISVTNLVLSAVTPENCKFVRIDWHIDFITADKIMFVEGDTLPEAYVPTYLPKYDIPKNKIVAIDETHWSGKKWISYGDSISAINNGNGLNLGWSAYVNSHYGFSGFYGRGVGGQSFIWNTNTFYANSDGTYAGRYGMNGLTSAPEGTTEHKGCFCSWDRICTMIPDNIKKTIDLVFIMGGTNDIGLFSDRIKWETPNFSAENVTDTDWVNAPEFNGGDYDITTFSGAICSAIMKMQIRCPNAVIVIGTPLSKWSNQNAHSVNGVTMEDVADVMIKTSRYMSTPVIDVNGTCGINGSNYSTYITDGTHPYSVAGHKMLARTVNGGLKSILPHDNGGV
jgi:lysophospholipase L1-like esterase